MDTENVPVEAPEVEVETPETTEVDTEVVAEPENPTETETPHESLFDLPDGRKLTAEQVKEEYLSLQKDYTQKAQRLAAIEKRGTPEHINKPEVAEWQKPDYVPKNYAELIEISKAQAIDELRKQAEAEELRQKEVVNLVDSQIAEIRKSDSKLDENALFLHANKFGFRDLKAAHSNMQAIKQAAIDAEQRTLKNIQTRGATPVAGTPGAKSSDGGAEYGAHRNYGSAIEYIRNTFPGKN